MKVYTSLPIGQTAAWKVKNGLEATSHQKLATDGASPELIYTHTQIAQNMTLLRAGGTQKVWHHLSEFG